eukprot:1267474-Prorocentrum_lima.AAC.1
MGEPHMVMPPSSGVLAACCRNAGVCGSRPPGDQSWVLPRLTRSPCSAAFAGRWRKSHSAAGGAAQKMRSSRYAA